VRYNPAVKSKRSNVEQASLFEMDRTEGAVSALSRPEIHRPFDDPQLLLGTSAFTAAGWPDSFYPPGMKSSDYLTYYATQFRTVEIDSTYYGTPAAATVESWYRKTPADFIFAAKIPQVITHTNMLVTNNHYAGNGPETVKLFWELLNQPRAPRTVNE
jgi:uncharacterized protein YecE (DUF72 family)